MTTTLLDPVLDSLLDRSLGDLARSIPGATALLHHLDLDFCCGGKQTLRAATTARGLDAEAIGQALSALQDQPLPGGERDWRQATAGELIDHLLARYHERHRAQLPELVRLSRRVESVHAERPECPKGLADHLEDMLQVLESHMQKEEQVLFPLLRQDLAPFAQGPITVMRTEHEGHGEALARMVELAHGLVMPRGACNTWRALILGLQTLREDLMQHIHLENNVLFEGLTAGTELAQSSGCCGACGGSSRG